MTDLNVDRERGQTNDQTRYDDVLRQSVGEIVARQRDLGIDVINDGEFGKVTRGEVDFGAWASYAWGRLAGWKAVDLRSNPVLERRRERRRFRAFYEWLDREHFVSSGAVNGSYPTFTEPISYTGGALIARDIANLKAALNASNTETGFLSSVAPGSFGRFMNQYYPDDESYVYALADAMRAEYQAIVEAGLILQIDDPGLPDTWDAMDPETTIEEYLRYATLRVEALNHALRGLPIERIRYHICWGSWHGPHSTDIPLADIIDVLLRVRTGAYSIEAANVRHEHEWKVWVDVKLPENTVLIPGVVSHATNVLEHPDLVADRILRFAEAVGRENVIAGTDCGLGGRVHEDIAWAKLTSLVQGAEIASRKLWPRRVTHA